MAVFAYILIRFRKWQFGLGALAALFHDVLVVLSVFAFARLAGLSFEIDEVFVAAILTIVGYSINDTVVVFDRVKEGLHRVSNKSGLRDSLNTALNGTLSRTLMTSITTLIVIIVLFIFGGEALAGFSFALLVGVLVGTYSSVFVATPIVLDTTKDEHLIAKKED
jgi:SecD/SecF fusion protein